MTNKRSPDRAYLIRCWQEGEDLPGALPRWRFSAEEVLHDRHRRGFVDLASLFAFLHVELGRDPSEPEKDRGRQLEHGD